jgi:hypothetical protein
LSELTEEVLAAGGRVAVTSQAGVSELSEGEGRRAVSESASAEKIRDGAKEKTNLHYIAWNPRSPISARAVVTEAVNRLESIDEAFVVFFADSGKKEFNEMSSADVEKTVDDSIKSYFFLVKEIFETLQRQKKGVLAFAHHDGGAEVLPPPQAAASAGFRAFASSLFAQYRNEPFGLYGYYSSSAETRTFARFLSGLTGNRTEKTARRWVRFSEKPGFFSFARNK